MTSSTTRTRTARPSDPAKKAAPKEPEVGPSGKKVSPEGITVQYEEITPEVARAMLEKNTENRALREGRVLALERDIRSGKFFHTHQGVAFNTNGTLVDGQHRLAAVVRAGIPVTMQVTRGLPVESKPVIDTGAKRTVADVLAFGGYQNTMVMASIVKMHLLYSRDTPMGQYVSALSQIEQVEHFEANEEVFITAAKLASAWRGHISAPTSVIGTAWIIFNEINPEEALQFFTDMVNMTTAGEGDARVALIHRLRRRIENSEKIPYSMQLSMFIKAWNAWRTGTPTTKIQVDRLRTKKVLEAI